MKKQEFLNKLRKELDVLEDKEIDDIISEYAGYIEEKVSRGLTEEEAVKELGDINEIVNDLLAAYKVKQKDNNYINRFINKVSLALDHFLNELSNKSGKDILKITIEIGLIILLILLCKIPFLLVKDLGWYIFNGLASPISNIFYGIWSFIIELSYFILAVVLFIKIMQRRYFQGFSEKIVNEVESENSKKKDKIKNKEEKERKEDNVTLSSPKRTSLIDMIVNICIFFLKIIVIMCLFGVICYLIGMAFALGLGIYLLIKGVTYYGIFLLLIALFLAGILLLELGIYFVLNKKIKAGHVLGEIIVIVILSGVGLSLGAIEVANTEIIYDSPYDQTQSVTKELAMSNDLTLYGKYNIIIDNTLTNTIKIEYIYPDINNIEVNIDLENYNNGYYLDYNIKNFSWNKDILNRLIEDLKDKKIYIDSFDIEKNVYISEENRQLLLENKEENQVIHEFTKIYNISNIEESNEETYLDVTLNIPGTQDASTVKIAKNLAVNLVTGNNYKFIFQYHEYLNEITEESIEEIFNRCNLIAIENLN